MVAAADLPDGLDRKYFQATPAQMSTTTNRTTATTFGLTSLFMRRSYWYSSAMLAIWLRSQLGCSQSPPFHHAQSWSSVGGQVSQ